MKKFILCIGIIISFISCESDDICTNPVITPRLIIRVYDKDATNTTKNVSNLLIYGKGHPENKALQFASTDSIVVPLKMLEKSSTFVLVKDAVLNNNILTSGEATELTIRYNPEQVFADKGCGYKVIYKEISAEKPTTSWISSVRVLFNHLEDEQKATIHIYY